MTLSNFPFTFASVNLKRIQQCCWWLCDDELPRWYLSFKTWTSRTHCEKIFIAQFVNVFSLHEKNLNFASITKTRQIVSRFEISTFCRHPHRTVKRCCTHPTQKPFVSSLFIPSFHTEMCAFKCFSRNDFCVYRLRREISLIGY